MCGICGCGGKGGRIVAPAGAPGQRAYRQAGARRHVAALPATVSDAGAGRLRTIRLEAEVLGANRRIAAANRARFAAMGVAAYNLLSSPGSGKTTLLCATIEALARTCPDLPVAVIEGDQQTTLDADRIRAAGAPAIQINTGSGCHLDARMVADAWARLRPAAPGAAAWAGDDAGRALLFIENVGNLVCPAMWDLGEAAKVTILSVTEGDDKPLKYPDMFAAADLVLLNKIDLLPHVDFDVARCVEHVRRVNPDGPVLCLSARTGEGVDGWLRWLLGEGAPARRGPAMAAPVATPERGG